MIDIGLYITYMGIIIATLLAVLFPVIFMFKDLRKSRSVFFGIGFLLLIYIISLILSTGEANLKYNISEGLSKQIGAGLISLYIMIFLCVFLIIVTEILRFLKR